MAPKIRLKKAKQAPAPPARPAAAMTKRKGAGKRSRKANPTKLRRLKVGEPRVRL